MFVYLTVLTNEPRLILDSTRFNLTLKRLCIHLLENHINFNDSVLIGLQPRGILLSRCILNELQKITGKQIAYGELDVTFFRDDFRMKNLIPSASNMNVIVDNKRVVLIDDVLFTGRSIRSGLDAIQQFGRPSAVELLVLVDRRFSRHVPIHPDYTGITVDVVSSESVQVDWLNESNAQITLRTKA